MDSDIVSIVQSALELAEVEDCENGVIIPENVFTSRLSRIIEKHNHHCIPMISRDKAKHMSAHLRALAQHLESY